MYAYIATHTYIHKYMHSHICTSTYTYTNTNTYTYTYIHIHVTRFLAFFGSTDVHQVLDAMEFAVYMHDVEHIIIDNLQFMTSTSGNSRSKVNTFDVLGSWVWVVTHSRECDMTHSNSPLGDVHGALRQFQRHLLNVQFVSVFGVTHSRVCDMRYYNIQIISSTARCGCLGSSGTFQNARFVRAWRDSFVSLWHDSLTISSRQFVT